MGHTCMLMHRPESQIVRSVKTGRSYSREVGGMVLEKMLTFTLKCSKRNKHESDITHSCPLKGVMGMLAHALFLLDPCYRLFRTCAASK